MVWALLRGPGSEAWLPNFWLCRDRGGCHLKVAPADHGDQGDLHQMRQTHVD